MVAVRLPVYALVSTLCLPHVINAVPSNVHIKRNATTSSSTALAPIGHVHETELETLEPRLLPAIAGIAGGFLLRNVAAGLVSAGAGFVFTNVLNKFFGDPESSSSSSSDPSASSTSAANPESTPVTAASAARGNVQIPDDFTPQPPSCRLDKDHLVTQSYIVGRKLSILRQLSADRQTDVSEQDVFQAQQSHWTAMHIVDSFVLGNEIGLPLQDEYQLRSDLSGAMRSAGAAIGNIFTQDPDVQQYLESIQSNLNDGERSLECN